MAITCNPYLSIADGKCREAMTFYGDVFGATPTFLPLSGMTNMPDDAEQIMHSELRADLITLMAADNVGHQDLKHGNTVDIALMAGPADLAPCQEIFAKLADGGQVTMAMEPQEWGAVYGQCIDRYGFSWAINVAQEQ